jgi:hypothetical protein
MSRGNIAFEMKTMTEGKAAISTKVTPIFSSEDGIIFGYSRITTSATLTALVDDGVTRFAPGCIIICVNSLAVSSVLGMVNYGTVATAPNFYSLITAGTDVGD